MKTISRQEAARLIREESKGRFFGVTFVKRGDRKAMPSTPYDRLPRRTMQARSVWSKDGLGPATYDAGAHGLIRVEEFVSVRDNEPHANPNLLPCVRTEGKQFRVIPVEGIEELRMSGEVYRVQ